ncbi:MAG: hypothetical protein ACYC99_14880 [Candidatus Geothermincolia bacterium]
MRWYTDDELAAMSTPVIRRMRGAIVRRNTPEAEVLCSELARERILLHDLQAETATALATYIGNALGEESLCKAYSFILEKSAKRQVFDLLAAKPDRALEAALLARNCWTAHSCGGAGEHGASFELLEDDEKFTFVLDPCGSGGRMWRKGLYSPPVSFGATGRAYTWSYGRKEFPYYCIHCAFLNELLPYAALGFITWPVDPPESAEDACRWHLYKNRDSVPLRYYERFGLEKKPAATSLFGCRLSAGLANAPERRDSRVTVPGRRRAFSERDLSTMSTSTAERIRWKLAVEDRPGALAVSYLMGSEFLFLHALYVNAIACSLEFLAIEAGEDAVGEALAFAYDRCAAGQVVSVLGELPRREILASLTRDFFLAGTCGGGGYPRSKIRVREDDASVTITLDPCPSGGRLIRRGAFGPLTARQRSREAVENGVLRLLARAPLPLKVMAPATNVVADYISCTRVPHDLGVTRGVHDWAGGRVGQPYYCALCTEFLRRSGCDWLEVSPPTDQSGTCVWKARKQEA